MHDNKKMYFADLVMDRVIFHLIHRGFAAQNAPRFQESRRVLNVRNTLRRVTSRSFTTNEVLGIRVDIHASIFSGHVSKSLEIACKAKQIRLGYVCSLERSCSHNFTYVTQLHTKWPLLRRKRSLDQQYC